MIEGDAVGGFFGGVDDADVLEVDGGVGCGGFSHEMSVLIADSATRTVR